MNAADRRRFLRLFFIFLLGFVSCIPARNVEAAETLRITIPGTVGIEGEAFVLADIAALDGPKALTEQAGALILSVRDGIVTREQVIGALKVSGLEGVRIELKMPAAVRVEKTTVAFPAEDTSAASAELPRNDADLSAVIKKLAAWEGEVEVQYQGTIPEGRLVAPASLVPGSASATLKFRGDSGRERSLAVRLVWSQSALILTRSVKRGETLRDTDVVVRQIRVNRPGVYASRVPEITGRSLRKNLSQGEPITLNLIADMPIIERGKSVTIIVQSGGLTVKAKGEALEDGSLGDSVKVRNLASKTVLTAIVVAKDTVEVKMP